MKRAVALIALGTALVLAGAGCGGSTSALDHGILLVGRAKYGKSQIVRWRPGSPAEPIGPAAVGISAPRWSPNGRSIAWDEAWIPEGGSYPESDGIGLMRSDGTHVKLLTRDNYYDGAPSWSPDGRYIVYVRAGRYGGERLVIVDVRTGHRRSLRVSPTICWPEAPCGVAWGKLGIAYQIESGIVLLNPATGRTRILARGNFHPDTTRSPSGALAVPEVNGIVLHLLSASGRALGKLRSPAVAPGCPPVWSPNGKQILVTAQGWHALWAGTVSTGHWKRLSVPIKLQTCAGDWR